MKAKVMIFLGTLLCMILMPFGLMAQNAEIVPETVFTVDLGTFTGLVAVVAFFATQLAKLIPYVRDNRWAKIVASILFGILICLGCWATHLTPFLEGLLIWQVLLYGLASGLSACGFYELVKPFIQLLGKSVEVDPDDENF